MKNPRITRQLRDYVGYTVKTSKGSALEEIPHRKGGESHSTLLHENPRAMVHRVVVVFQVNVIVGSHSNIDC